MSCPATGTKRRRLWVAFCHDRCFSTLLHTRTDNLVSCRYIAITLRVSYTSHAIPQRSFFFLEVRHGRSSWTSAPSWSLRPSPGCLHIRADPDLSTPQMPEKIPIATIEPMEDKIKIRCMQQIPDFHRFPSFFILFDHYHSPINRHHHQKKTDGDASLSQSNPWPEVCRSSRRPWRFAAMCTGSTTTCCAYLSPWRAIDENRSTTWCHVFIWFQRVYFASKLFAGLCSFHRAFFVGSSFVSPWTNTCKGVWRLSSWEQLPLPRRVDWAHRSLIRDGERELPRISPERLQVECEWTTGRLMPFCIYNIYQ